MRSATLFDTDCALGLTRTGDGADDSIEQWAPANHCSIMDTHTVVSIVPAVMQAAQLRGAAVLDAAAFGMRVLCSAVWRASTLPLESGPAAMLLGVCVCTVAPIMLAVLRVALARSAWAELPWSRRVFVAR